MKTHSVRGLLVLSMLALTIVVYSSPHVASKSPVPIFTATVPEPVLKPTQPWEGTLILSASVLYDGGEFKAWYTAGSVQTKTMMSSIGYANSSDGIHWTKYEKNPVFTALGTGSGFDSVSVAFASVVKNGTQYSMYYRGSDGYDTTIGLATSTDGISWTRYHGSYTHIAGTMPNVIFVNNQWKMYYMHHGGTIGVATSSDGLSWTNVGSDIVPTPSGYTNSYAPAVVFAGGQFNMWFSSDAAVSRLFYATSPDGVKWTIYSDNPLPGVQGSTYAAVVTTESTTYLWYSGAEPALYLATTTTPLA